MDKLTAGYSEEHVFLIEQTLPDGSFKTVWRGDSFKSGVDRLCTIKSKLRHELWSYGWIHTSYGSAPMASIN